MAPPKKFGDWSFSPAHGTFSHTSPPFEIELWRLTDSAAILNLIYDIQEAGWAGPEVIGDLVTGLVFTLGRTMCTDGKDNAFDAKAKLKDDFGSVVDEGDTPQLGPDEPWE